MHKWHTEPTFCGPDRTAFDVVTVQAAAMSQAGNKSSILIFRDHESEGLNIFLALKSFFADIF